ncbi:MAG: diguanylate cyclase [Methylococcales bacterium]|nr:diguanylate cyclase [Methylococcales bacterium]
MVRNSWRYFLILFCLWLIANNAFAEDNVLDVSKFNQDAVSLTQYFAVLEDSTTALTLADLQLPENSRRFQTNLSPSAALNYGYTTSAYWLRLALKNSSDKPIERMLEMDQPLLERLDFYYPSEHFGYQAIETGYSKPFANRPHKSRNFVFPIVIPASSDYVVFLRVETPNSIIIPCHLWEPKAFYAHERGDYVIQSLYYGIMLAMVIINFLLYLNIKDINYLLFTLSVIFGVLSHICVSGIGSEFIFGDNPFLAKSGTGISVSLSFIMLLLFARRMLDTETLMPKLDNCIKFFIGMFLICVIFFIISFQTVAKFAALFQLTTTFLLLIIPLICALKGQRGAYFFLGTFATLSIFLVLRFLALFNVLSISPLFEYGTLIGQEVEVFMLSFALADRYKSIHLEKENAQQLLVENLKNSEHVLEIRVQERTTELEIANRKLKALSRTDGLTGIANRRNFDETLIEEWQRAKSTKQSLALMLLDVDWFKKYNDFYGHQMGDECLKAVAQILKDNLSHKGDLVARYGGEEFVFLMPETRSDEAFNVAQKICTTFQVLAMPHNVSDFGYVSVSIGVAVITPTENVTPHNLIHVADEALYSAKNQGRNRAVLAMN